MNPLRRRSLMQSIRSTAAAAVVAAAIAAAAGASTADANVAVTNVGNNSVAVYAGSVLDPHADPIQTIAGAHTGLDQPLAIAADRGGAYYVANSHANSVTVYPPTAKG